VVERVIEWEPGRRLKVELSEMNLPVKWALAEMSLSSINDHETEALISMVFQPRFGLLGALMGVLMM